MSNISSKIQKFTSSIVRKAKEIKESIVDFFLDLKQNGIKKATDRIKESFKNNVLVHFQSKENFSKLVNNLKERLSLKRISESVNSYLERLNERLFGV